MCKFTIHDQSTIQHLNSFHWCNIPYPPIVHKVYYLTLHSQYDVRI